MSKPNIPTAVFPSKRPEIVLSPIDAPTFPVDCRELRWWFIEPEPRNRRSWAIYDWDSSSRDWRLGNLTHMQVVGPAEIHGVECVEIAVQEYENGEEISGIETMYALQTDDSVEWLAVLTSTKEKRILQTFLDEGFDADWGAVHRRIVDTERFTKKGGEYSFDHNKTEPESAGVGVWSVVISGRMFRCLRVIDLDGSPSELGILTEAFLTEEGETVLSRRYNGRLWANKRYKMPWDEKLPDAQRIYVDGVMYVHWYDCLTDVSLGISV